MGSYHNFQIYDYRYWRDKTTMDGWWEQFVQIKNSITLKKINRVGSDICM